MIRVHVFVEGQTEETFVRELLQDHFSLIGIYLNPILIRTGKKGKGGVSTYGKIQWQIKKKCKEPCDVLLVFVNENEKNAVYAAFKEKCSRDPGIQTGEVLTYHDFGLIGGAKVLDTGFRLAQGQSIEGEKVRR